MINERFIASRNQALDKAAKHSKEIIQYKKTRTVKPESTFTKEELEEYSKYSNKKIQQYLQGYFIDEVCYTFGNIYTFTAEELADFTKIELDVTQVAYFLFDIHMYY